MVFDFKKHRRSLWHPSVIDIHSGFFVTVLICLLQQGLKPTYEKRKSLERSTKSFNLLAPRGSQDAITMAVLFINRLYFIENYFTSVSALAFRPSKPQ